MDISAIFIFLTGLVILTIASEFILRGASSIAALLGIRPMVIGLTVVSIGTSLPELAVGITAVSEGKGALAIGNIAGTNIFNILFIIGLSAAIRPLKLRANTVRFDVIVMIIASVILLLLSINGRISRFEGILMVISAIIYYYLVVSYSKKESKAVQKEYSEEYSSEVLIDKKSTWIWVYNSVFLLGGMMLTIWGADLLVAGAVSIAQHFGMSDAVIGLSIVAIGTSAPELVTTIVATIKNDRDVAIGNLIGSSITNILVILGITCAISPNGVDVGNDVLWFDIPLAAFVAIVCYPVFRSDGMVSRKEGILFIAAYLIYFASLLIFRV